MVREHLRIAAESASRWYNHKTTPRQLEAGTKVRVYYPRRFVGRSPKWQSFYKTEGEIVKKLKRRHISSSEQKLENTKNSSCR